MAETMWKRMRRWLERRLTLRDPGLVEVIGVPAVKAGVVVTPATAVQFSAVYNAVRILSESVAQLPLHLYRRRPDGGRSRAEDHPLYRVLHDQPNPVMASFQWREAAMWHLLLWGNAYAEVVWQDGYPVELWPIAPWLVRPEAGANGRSIVYRVTVPNGDRVVLPQERVLHIVGPGWDGLVGKSVIALARESIGLGMAAEQFGAQFFGRGAHMAGVLKHPGVLDEQAKENIERSWQEAYGGLSNAHRIAILEEGMTYERIGIPPEDAQFLQTREFQVEEVARWFNLPPHMLKDLRRSTFSNIEHQALEFVKYSLLPWLRRFEQAIQVRLLGGEDQRDLFVEFSVDGLLRGDIESRYRAYAIARQWGWFSANDIRRLENQDPIEGGDVYLQPLNMVPAGTNPALAAGGERGERSRPLERRSIEGRRRLRSAYQSIMTDAAGRLVRREVAEVRRRARSIWGRRDRSQWEAFLEEFYAEFQEVVGRIARPVLRSLAEQAYAEAMEEIGSDDPMGPDFERFIEDYVAAFAARWRDVSRGQLRQVAAEAEAAGEDPLDAIEQRLAEWEERRAEKIGRREPIRAGEAFAKAAWVLAGVVALRWSVVGETCPFCDQLNGRTVGVQVPFLAKGQTLTAPGASPLTSHSSIGHPPLHDGCDCMITPVVSLRGLGAGLDSRSVLDAILEQARSEEPHVPEH